MTPADHEDISLRRCFHHAQREAVARCPECRRFFCRECVTEHEDRVICAACLRQLATRSPRTARLQAARYAAACLAGFLCLWLICYGMGRILLLVPSSFHEGTLWRNLPWELP